MLLCACIGVLSFSFLDVEQYICKVESLIHIAAHEEITTIKIPATEFAQYKNKSEIRVAGKLYDVSSYSENGDTVSVQVWYDDHEEKIQQKITALFEPSPQYYRHNTENHFLKYKPFVPDGKILNTCYSLTFFESAIETQTVACCNQPVLSVSPTDVIKPPPDQLLN